jgi:hypothetical protein
MKEKTTKPKMIFKTLINSTFGTTLCLDRISNGSHQETMSREHLCSSDLSEKSPPPIVVFTRRVSKTGKILDT